VTPATNVRSNFVASIGAAGRSKHAIYGSVKRPRKIKVEGRGQETWAATWAATRSGSANRSRREELGASSAHRQRHSCGPAVGRKGCTLRHGTRGEVVCAKQPPWAPAPEHSNDPHESPDVHQVQPWSDASPARQQISSRGSPRVGLSPALLHEAIRSYLRHSRSLPLSAASPLPCSRSRHRARQWSQGCQPTGNEWDCMEAGRWLPGNASESFSSAAYAGSVSTAGSGIYPGTRVGVKLGHRHGRDRHKGKQSALGPPTTTVRT
jgi:hypothetical protein